MPLSAQDGDWTRLATLLISVLGMGGSVLAYLLKKIEGVREETADTIAAGINAMSERTEASINELRATDNEMMRTMVRHDELDRLGQEMRAQGVETRSALASVAARIDTLLERMIAK